MELEEREVARFIISAQLSEFENVINNMLFKIFGRLATKATHRTGNDFSTHLEYLLFHTIFDFKISVVKEGLDILLTVRNGVLTEDEKSNVQLHIDQISCEIKENLQPANFPLGFKNLILDEEHSMVMEQLWEESQKAQKAKAYLSTIVILGSILEGLLYHQITKSDENMAKAGGCSSSPKEKGKVLSFEKWSLNDMIVVSYKCSWVNEFYYGHSDALRKHRNFVHPFLQLNETFMMPNENACELSRVVLKGIFENLLRNS